MKEGFNDDGGESGIFSLSIGKEEMVYISFTFNRKGGVKVTDRKV